MQPETEKVTVVTISVTAVQDAHLSKEPENSN